MKELVILDAQYGIDFNFYVEIQGKSVWFGFVEHAGVNLCIHDYVQFRQIDSICSGDTLFVLFDETVLMSWYSYMHDHIRRNLKFPMNKVYRTNYSFVFSHYCEYHAAS